MSALAWSSTLAAEQPPRPGAPSERSRQDAFEAEALPHRRALYAASYRLTGRAQDAEDLVQETYLRAYRAFERYTPGTNIRGWLFTILYRVRTDDLRRAACRVATVSLLCEPAGRTGEAPFESEDLERALLGLPEGYRAAVLLRDLEGFSYQEIARMLQLPIGTVMSRLHRSRAMLRSALGGGFQIERSSARSAGRRGATVIKRRCTSPANRGGAVDRSRD
jgi:RNA polymerase sigma-70 factor (ECF subfamily)